MLLACGCRRTIYDAVNDKQVVLSDEEMRIVHRLRHGKFPDAAMDPYPDYVPYYSSIKEIHPMGNPMPPKARFIPSKHEGRAIVRDDIDGVNCLFVGYSTMYMTL